MTLEEETHLVIYKLSLENNYFARYLPNIRCKMAAKSKYHLNQAIATKHDHEQCQHQDRGEYHCE